MRAFRKKLRRLGSRGAKVKEADTQKGQEGKAQGQKARWLRAFIPQKVPNAGLLAFLDFCACFRTSEGQSRRNYVANLVVLTEMAETADTSETAHIRCRDSLRPIPWNALLPFYRRNAFLENQSQWRAVRFGRFTMDYSGCEVIATYNALLSLGRELSESDMADLIRAYERRGALLWGGWGVSPKAIRRYFAERGYGTAMTCSRAREDIEAIGRAYRAVIITVYNDAHDIMQQVHTMHVSKQAQTGGRERFILHNGYRTGADGTYVAGSPCDSLWEVIESIQGGAAAPISIIGIGDTASSEKQKLGLKQKYRN